jgi:FAD/FMN-containing dehydrogenase
VAAATRPHPGADRQLLSDLEGALGRSGLQTDPEVCARYTRDWTGRYLGSAAAVVRPERVDQVQGVVEAAARHGAALIPQGGNTGLVGGSVPRPAGALDRPQIVLSMSGFGTVEELDPAGRLLCAGAGVTLAAAQAAAAKAGFHLGIDLSSRDSATLGGMAATNAGGMQMLRFGGMRTRVAGIEAVLADRSIVSRLSGLVKDNVGWDPAALFVGSEGTLAVITRVMVRLEPLPAHRVTALVALASVGAALELLAGPLTGLPSLEAAELTLEDGMRLVAGELGLPPPVGLESGTAGRGGRAWLTLEAAAPHDPTAELAAAVEHPSVLGAAVASDTKGRARLWAYRERHTEAVARLGIPHKLDVSVARARLEELLGLLPERVAAAAPAARLIMWGHAADGNVHVNVVGPPPDDDGVDDAVLRLVAELGGSISAEHGVGVARRRWLRLVRSEGDLRLMARVKTALDPGGLLNPGVLEPLP